MLVGEGDQKEKDIRITSTTMSLKSSQNRKSIKAMDDIGVIMTPFGDVVTVSLVANSYVVGFTK